MRRRVQAIPKNLKDLGYTTFWGKEILRTEDGIWVWDKISSKIHYIPKFDKTPKITRSLWVHDAPENDVIMRACKEEFKRRKNVGDS